MTSPDVPRKSSKWLPENYDPLEILGQGAQGSVVLSRNIHTHALVAIKSVLNNRGHASKMTEREARFLSAIHMNNIARLHEWYMTSTEYILIMEACDSDLFRFMDIYAQIGMRLPQRFVWRVFSRIADALAFLHHSGIVHHDIKPPNILMKWGGRSTQSEYPDAILADFGAATQNTESNYSDLAAPAYTMLYHPPDELRGPTMDVWALGSIIHEIALGRTVVKPCPDNVKADKLAREIWIKDANNKRIGRGVDKVYSPELETFMYACLRFTPDNRITSKKLASGLRDMATHIKDTVPFEPLQWACRALVETRAAEALARKREAERVDALKRARPKPNIPEATD